MLDKLIAIVATAFVGKFDKGGQPYILHCLHVMHKVGHKTNGDHIAMAIAVAHDLIEDTDWTADMLRDEGIPEEVIEGLECLTHYPIGHPQGLTYDDYIKSIAAFKDHRVVIVKMFDLEHNSKIHRMKGLREKDFKRLEKYHRSYAFLASLYFSRISCLFDKSAVC